MKVAFVTHNALGALRHGAGKHIGGIERQVSLMARWFAGRGHRVSVLVWDEGQQKRIEIDGIEIIPICPRDAGLPVVRFFHPRWSGLLKAMRTADADIYYQNGAEYVTGQVALWCSSQRRPMVFSTASDMDCEINSRRLTTLREKILYRIGVRRASRIVVQTGRQAAAMKANFGRDSVVFPMGAVDPFDGTELVPRRETWAAFRVCWVGRLSREKRLEWLLDLAEAHPELAFDVVGASDTEPDYASALQQRAAGLSNVIWHGRLAPQDVPRIYAQASALCCTSLWEGFPNTFLEAWAHGVPVLSTVDPDGVIERAGLGFQTTDKSAFGDRLTELRQDFDKWATLSTRCRRHFLETFDRNTAFARFETLFTEVIAASR